MIPNVRKIIGKTITGVVVKKSYKFPKSQVFLIFSDNTSFEFYSDEFGTISNADTQPGGLNWVKAYMEDTHEIVFESSAKTETDSCNAELETNEEE